MTGFSQPDLVCAILGELDRQQPGARVTQYQFNTLVDAANLVIAAMNAPADQDRAA